MGKKANYVTNNAVYFFIFTKAVYSTCGMMTSPLFQLGKSSPIVYNLWVIIFLKFYNNKETSKLMKILNFENF